jgi:glycosyltransferase involved in cell wall biosynthesis
MAVKLCFIMSYLILFSLIKKVRGIHAWCTPAGAIGYIVSVITGQTLILDSFEPHAETMVEVGTWKKQGAAFRLLFKFEKLQLKRAQTVICAAQSMIGHSQEVYGVKKQRCYTKPACVDLELFNPLNYYNETIPDIHLKKNVCVYAGKFGGIYLEKEVFDFFKVAYDHWKGDFTALLLTGHSDDEINKYCGASGLPSSVIIKQFVPHDEVPRYLAMGTFGICPVKPIPSKRYCSPIKNGEYWAMGLPVVITQNISIDSELIETNNAGYVLKDLVESEYLNAVKKIDSLTTEPNLKTRIRALAEQNRNFTDSEKIYRAIYA